MYYEYMTTQYFVRFFFIHLKPRVESFWGILSMMSAFFRSEFYTRMKKILGRKHIYLPHVQTAIYDSKVVIFKTGNILSTWSWLNAIVRYECENSAIDVIINFLWKIFHKHIILVVLRSCIVPAEITEPPTISGGQNHKYDMLVEYFS
jgi:hypothetical protein